MNALMFYIAVFFCCSVAKKDEVAFVMILTAQITNWRPTYLGSIFHEANFWMAKKN